MRAATAGRRDNDRVTAAVLGIGVVAVALVSIALGSMVVRDALYRETLSGAALPVVGGWWGLVFVGIVVAWVGVRLIRRGVRR